MPDRDGLAGLAAEFVGRARPVRAVIESMNGARFVHDTLELAGWDVEIADAAEGEGLGTVGVQDRSDRCLGVGRVVASGSGAVDLVAVTGVRAHRERARFRLHLVHHRVELKNRIHATLIAYGCRARCRICSAPRDGLARRGWRSPSRGHQMSRRDRADRSPQHPDRPARGRPPRGGCRSPVRAVADDLPGISWILAYTIAAEIGDIDRFESPKKLCGYTGLCPTSTSQATRPPGPAHQAGSAASALGVDRGHRARRPPPRLQRPLRAHPSPPRPSTWTESGPHRSSPPARRGDLVHAHPQPTVQPSSHRPARGVTNPSTCSFRQDPSPLWLPDSPL